MRLRRRAFLSAASPMLGLLAAGVSLQGCGSEAPKIDLLATLDRSVQAIEIFDKYLKDNEINDVGDPEMAAFADFLTKAMNSEPPIYEKRIAVRLQDDASFDGYADSDGDGDFAGESALFTIEIDSANNRLIATNAAGVGTSLGVSGAAFLSGAFMTALLGRQSAAGVAPGAFDDRRLTPAPTYARMIGTSGAR